MKPKRRLGHKKADESETGDRLMIMLDDISVYFRPTSWQLIDL